MYNITFMFEEAVFQFSPVTDLRLSLFCLLVPSSE